MNSNIIKGTKIYSIFTGKCPVCQNNSMYVTKNPYKLTDTLKMHRICRNCGTRYFIEPSFFFGAMYVSYPVGIIFATIAFIISFYVLNFNLMYTYLVIVLVMVFSLPIILRLSRNIWINFFFSYKKSSGKH